MKRFREEAEASERSDGAGNKFRAKVPPEEKKSGDSPVQFETQEDRAPHRRAPPQASPIRRKSAPLPTFASTHASEAYKSASELLKNHSQAAIGIMEGAIATVQSQLPEHLQKTHESLAPLFYLHGVALLTELQHERDFLVDEYTDEEREDMEAIRTLLFAEERLQGARTIVSNLLAENEESENDKYLDKLKLFLHLTQHALAELEMINNIPNEAAEYYMGSVQALQSMSDPNPESVATAQFYAAHQFMIVADNIKGLELEEGANRPSTEDVALQAALAASAAEAIAASEEEDVALQAALAASVADAKKQAGEEDEALQAAIAASEAEAIAASAEGIAGASPPPPSLEDNPDDNGFEYAKSKSLAYYADCAKTLEQIICRMCDVDDISEFVVTETKVDEEYKGDKTSSQALKGEQKSAGLKTTGLDEESDKENIEKETFEESHRRDVDKITSIMDRVEALAAQVLTPERIGEHVGCMYYIGWLEVVQQLAEDILWDRYNTQCSAADLKPTRPNY